MKTKNMKDRPPPVEPVKKVEVAPAKKWGAGAGASEVKKEPKLYLSKGTWFCEYYDGGEVSVPDVQVKENIYIVKCKNVHINIPAKCKSIQVDGCNKIQVTFKSIVSIFEVFNSQRVAVYCEDVLPSVAIDKSQGVQIHLLTRAAVALAPDIITSSVSELNLVVPGKTDEDDPIEIALPEQYITKYKDGKLVTEPVSHGE
jgi:adenylyl cyclase-associated protein